MASGTSEAMNIEIRTLQSGDEAFLSKVAPGVFDNPIDPALTAEFLADDRHHLIVAVDDEVVVGFASGVHYIHPDKAPELWINEVGVAPAYRCRGIGTSVLKQLLEVGRALNCNAAWVLTDQGNRAAMSLYAALGGTPGVGGSGPENPAIGYSFALKRK